MSPPRGVKSHPCLVINAGSSSVKFSVFDLSNDTLLFKDEIERVDSIEGAIKLIVEKLHQAGHTDIKAIGHRVAHGGERFRDAALINDALVKIIEEYTPLAPLHNPPILAGIAMTRKRWPDVPQVAVFDTAFHQTMPPCATTYAVPEAWREMGLRRYGFHGTSHKYVMQRVAQELNTTPAQLRIISCHLGNGASVCAIDRGVSVDTSMGMTALEGLVMGTRSGDVDPGIFAYLKRALGLSVEQIEDALYKKSGLAALSGLGNDMRDIEKQAATGNVKARLAVEVYAYRVRKYIGAYAAAMGGCDVLAFTGGIGENSTSMRSHICRGLEFMGLDFDEEKNRRVKLEGFEAPQIQRSGSRIRVMVTETREQWMIAQETARICGNQQKLKEAGNG